MGLTVTQLLRLRRFESCSPHIFFKLYLQVLKSIFKFAHRYQQMFWKQNAEVAQLVERQPSKLNVAGSTPVFRSKNHTKNGVIFLFLQ